jgi:ribose transport system substrate-binding protein
VKRTLTFLVPLVVSLLGAGWGAAAAGTQDDKGLVVLSQAGLENEWRTVMTQDMEKTFNDAGYDFAWTNAESDPAKQLADVEDLLARQPELLILAPVEFEPLAPVADMAEDAGVPLMVVDRAIPGEPGTGTWIALLTIDFVETGRLVATDVVDELTKKNGEPRGRLLHVTGNQGASPVIDEQKGLDEVFANYPNIEIVASCDGRYSREPGRTCTEDLLQRFPEGEIDGIIFDSDDMALGGLQAIEAAGRTELLNFIWGKDATLPGLQALRDNKITYTVSTPNHFGAMTLQVYEQSKAGEEVEPLQYIPKEIYDNDTPEDATKVQTRIEEMEQQGIGCC